MTLTITGSFGLWAAATTTFDPLSVGGGQGMSEYLIPLLPTDGNGVISDELSREEKRPSLVWHEWDLFC